MVFCTLNRLSDHFGASAHASVLLANGAPLTPKDKNGRTPFDATPGSDGNCQAETRCPLTCNVLRNNVSSTDLALVKAGKPLN